MDDSEGDKLPRGLLPEQAAAYAASYAKSISVDNERWAKAELRTAEIVEKIQPTRASEERRKAVAEFVRNLICKCFPCSSCKVFTFGSVPLLTYLPDGDIDLTIVSQDPSLKDTWANVVRSTLERTERNQDAEFKVREVQYIHAEVKLIKCVVEDIIVDISFNQLGGLCTLCFLDEVDLLIGQNHFFKRSIILVKAWCYYESTLLGAHHGLISTYALETLVLYIFHVFHNSIRGPLEVLLRFLEFFSKFDWHRYCVSLWGPVPIAALPDIAAESPRKDGGDLLLSQAFLKACCEVYAVFPAGQDNQQRTFNAKYLNVVDPLRPGNNLGRSVNQTNYNRIVGTFGKSAEKLLRILHDSSKDIVEQLEDRRKGFFKRIRRKLDILEERRPDAPDFIARPIPSSLGSNHLNGYALTSLKAPENGDSMRTYGAETYYVDQRFQKPLGWVSDYDPRTHINTRVAQMIGNQTHIASAALLQGVGDASVSKTGLAESPLDNGVPGAVSNGCVSPFETFPSNYVGGTGTLQGNDAFEKPKGHSRRGSLEFPIEGAAENGVGRSRQWGDARDLAPSDVRSSEEGDVKSEAEDYLTNGAIPGSSRSRHSGSNLSSNYASSTAASQTTSPEYIRANGNFASEDSSEGSTSLRNSGNPSSDREASRRASWAGEQAGHRDSGTVDKQGFAHRMQDANSRGQTIPLSMIPPSFVQIPSLTLPHPGQLPMHLATSVAMPSTIGHPSLTLAAPPPPPPLGLHSVHPSSILGDTTLGLSHRGSPYYSIPLPRGPPAPPLPPSYFQGHTFMQPPVENSSPVNNRISAYPGQQVDENKIEQLWQQAAEQPQVQDHQQQYGVHRAVSTGAGASNSLVVPQLTDSDSSVSTTMSRSQTQGAVPSSSKSGSTPNVDSSSDASSTREASDDAPAEENVKSSGEEIDTGNNASTRGKVTYLVSEERARGNKTSKSSREKRGQLKQKNSTNDETVEAVKSVDLSPSPAAENVVHWTSPGSADDLTVTQGYPQLVHSPASVIYPNLLPSSLPIPGNGSMSAEMSPYPPPPLLPTHRSPGAHSSSLPTTSQAQSPMNSAFYPGGATSAFRPPVTELVSGTISSGSAQRPRQMETASIHPPPYYQSGHPFFHSVYSVPIYYGMVVDFGFHFSSSVDNFDSSAVQAAENLRLKSSQQMGFGVGEKLKALGIPALAGFNTEQTSPDSRHVDQNESKENGVDLLNSDFLEHLNNLEVARQCQRATAQAYQQPSYPNPSAKYYPTNYRSVEGPGRPLGPAVNMLTNVMGHGHGLVQGPSLNASGRMVGNYPRTYTGPVAYGAEEQSKSHGGTGTYLPTPRPGYYRDRQSSGSTRQHGGYGQDRNERSEREGHQGHNQYRNRTMGRGQNKYDFRSQSNNVGGVDRNNVDVKAGERGRDGQRLQDGPRRNSVQSAPNAAFASSSPGQSTVTVLPATGSVGIPAGICPVPIMTTTGKLPTPGMEGIPVPPVVMVYPFENRMDYVTEPLEFGSLGPVSSGISQDGTDANPGAATAPCPPGSALASGDRSPNGPSSPKQRVMQRTYQLKEEDFPPLCFPGQHGSSSTGYNNGSSTNSRVSPFPTYVATPSS
ncbi:hypothetical protein R1flu_006255 [Riccia fluitans]|uniref:Polymerase nucleotidyl transferase domain-containing protein n=1 Tax=Riccia fluitans TaxID=41844 RepID=A0ABD1YW52_9MARC